MLLPRVLGPSSLAPETSEEWSDSLFVRECHPTAVHCLTPRQPISRLGEIIGKGTTLAPVYAAHHTGALKTCSFASNSG